MTKKNIIAVGGGEIGRVATLPNGTTYQTEIETTLIDKFIVDSTGKTSPKLLFIGTASNDSQGYFEIIKTHFKDRLGCSSVEPLNLINTQMSFAKIKEKILSADIIYVGGGDTTKMLKIWKSLGVDRLLYEAYQQGITLSGISAGAICWFEYYDNMDDIENIEQLEIIPGLSFVKGFGVPHYNCLSDDEKSRINRKLKDKNIKGWSIDDCVAIAFQDDGLKVISCRPDRTATQIP